MICINIFEQKTHSTCRSKNWLVSFAFFFDIGWYKSNKANHFFFFLLKISMWETEDLFVYTSKNNYQWNEFFKLQTQKKIKRLFDMPSLSFFFFFFTFSPFPIARIVCMKEALLLLTYSFYSNLECHFCLLRIFRIKRAKIVCLLDRWHCPLFFCFHSLTFFLVFYFSLFFMSVALTNCLNS